MSQGHTLPNLWLLSDARNDEGLDEALARLPRSSAFVFRHYHLDESERRTRFDALKDTARRHNHVTILSASPATAKDWGADGVYGPAEKLGTDPALLRLAAAHSLAEIRAAEAANADGIFLSPVFPTRSHPGAGTLGKDAFLRLMEQTALPIIALGGMNAERALELGQARWGAIDGLS